MTISTPGFPWGQEGYGIKNEGDARASGNAASHRSGHVRRGSDDRERFDKIPNRTTISKSVT